MEYTTDGQETIEEWKEAVRTGRGTQYLRTLDTKNMEQETLVALFSDLLLELYDMENYDDSLLEDLLSTFEILRQPFSRQCPLWSILPCFPLFDPGALSWLWMRKEADIVTIILDLIEWLPNEQADLVMRGVVKIFLREDPTQIYDVYANPSKEGNLSDLLPASTIGFLMDKAEPKGNDGIWNYLRKYVGIKAPARDPGPWMIDGSPSEEVPIPLPYIIGEPLSHKVLREINSESLLQTQNETISILTCLASIADSKAKKDIFRLKDKRYKTAEQERELFRIYGPSNTFILPQPDEDIPLGADRMFLCNVFNYDEDEDIEEPIFNGYCDWKGHKIKDARSAVRRPVPGGGWVGSYCSLQCIREQLEDSRSTGDIPEVDAIEAVVDEVERQLMKYGIYKHYGSDS